MCESLSLSILFKPHETAKMTERLKRPIYARFCTIFVLSHKLYRNFIVEEGSVLLLTHIYVKDYVWRLYLTLNSKRPPRRKKSRDPKKRFCPRIVCNFYSVLIRRGSLSLSLVRQRVSSIAHTDIRFDGAMRSCYALSYRSLGGAIPGPFVQPLRSIN